MTSPVIIARNLTKTFRTPKKEAGVRGAVHHLLRPQFEDRIAVDSIDLSIAAGESVAYVGPSGVLG